jgi:hypothetical protein
MGGPDIVSIQLLFPNGRALGPPQAPGRYVSPYEAIRRLTGGLGWTIRVVLSNGQTVIVRAIRVRDKLSGRTGRQVGRTREGRLGIDWDDGGTDTRDPDTLERVR